MISLIMPYYRNAGMLALQYDGWAGWADKLKAQYRIILIDDGSPEAAIDVPRPEGLPALAIWRVLEDRPWHQHAARNLGAHVAPEGWMLMTDMDHVLTAEHARGLAKRIGRLDPDTIYMLNRIEATTGEPTRDALGREKPHPNSFVLTRDLFWRIGGYDEDYCGVYGTDGLFKRRAFRIGYRGHLAKVALTRYWRELVPDASTTTLARKEGRDPEAKKRIAELKRARDEAHKVKVLDFPWERVL